MKCLSKALLVLFIACCLPLLISCGNSFSELGEKCNITFDLNSEYGKLSKPIKEGDNYSVELEGLKVAQIKTNGINILNEIIKDTELILKIYISINSYDIELKINGEEVGFKVEEKGEYSVIEVKFVVEKDINFFMNGCFELMI